MNYLKLSSCLFIILFMSISVNAQFSIYTQQRTRFEMRDGYKKLANINQDAAYSISERTRLTFDYTTDKIKIVITPQDVRIWGDESLMNSTGVYGDDYSLSLFEGYAEFAITQNLWFSAGRQQLKYDNERILAARNWNQNGIAYDVAMLKFQKNNFKLHVAGSWNSISQSDNLFPNDRLKSLNFIWINKKLNDKSDISFLHLVTANSKTDSTNVIYIKQTSGIYANLGFEDFNIKGDVYYQYGKNKTGQNVNAYILDADLSYKINNFTPHIGVGYLSGDSDITDNTDNLFDVFYGARHKYFGFIDYFSDFTKSTKQAGLADYYILLSLKASKKLCIENTAHYFQLATVNSATPSDKNLGFENDIVIKYKFNEWGELNCGYSFFMPTETLETIQSVSNPKFSQFFYAQLTINPVIFKSEDK